MKKELVAAAILSALVGANAQAADAKTEREKCYGVAKAGKNDCSSKDGAHACAGQAPRDNDPNEWVYVPLGECAKQGGIKG